MEGRDKPEGVLEKTLSNSFFKFFSTIFLMIGYKETVRVSTDKKDTGYWD